MTMDTRGGTIAKALVSGGVKVDCGMVLVDF